ncbi:hypothetical protein D3C72_1691680 [compost metagenome]
MVKAFSWPPSAATRRENSPAGTLFVPLNSMCSSTCATPVVPSTSSMEPTRTQTICTAVGERRSVCTITVMPLARVNCWGPGAAAAGVDAAGAGVDWACAGTVHSAESARASTAPDAARRGERCFIEWVGL